MHGDLKNRILRVCIVLFVKYIFYFAKTNNQSPFTNRHFTK